MSDLEAYRAKAAAWPDLLPILEEPQRKKFKAYTEALDEQVVKRHEAACLLFLDLLDEGDAPEGG